ncbi:hypothetical protein ACIA5D_45095 [Actinoplanes sp. NPDC051513]|uniref:hypothetical protein n=1 Tax=Actinoplanes sp. NPDC051513 TaxID=3363908 RepID=UPI003796A9EA
MLTRTDGVPDRARGTELANAAEALLAEARLDTIDVAHAVQLAAASAVLALYWEVRHQGTSALPADRVDQSRWDRPAVPANEPGA